MAKQPDGSVGKSGDQRAEYFGEPPSLNLPPRSIVGHRGRDYPEDAPTVMMRDLAEIGIDPAVLAATPGPGMSGSYKRTMTPAPAPAPRRHRSRATPRPTLSRPAADPHSVAVISPVRVPRPVDFDGLEVPMPEDLPSDEPATSLPQMVLFGVIAAVPVLVSLGIAAWMLWT